MNAAVLISFLLLCIVLQVKAHQPFAYVPVISACNGDGQEHENFPLPNCECNDGRPGKQGPVGQKGDPGQKGQPGAGADLNLIQNLQNSLATLSGKGCLYGRYFNFLIQYSPWPAKDC